MTNGLTVSDADAQDRADSRRLVIKIVGMTAGFFLFLIFLGIACVTTTMDVNNDIHVNWWWLVGAAFWACVFMYHTGIS